LMSRVKVHSCGVSDTGKRIELYMPRDRDFLGTGNSIYNKPGIKNVDATVCDVVRLDDYFQVPEGRRVSCVKLDVEGHEFAAVTGMAGILKKHRPSLIVEVWPHESDSLKAFFGDLGYTWSVIDGMNWLFTP
jgi:FkbM family methyltransferase